MHTSKRCFLLMRIFKIKSNCSRILVLSPIMKKAFKRICSRLNGAKKYLQASESKIVKNLSKSWFCKHFNNLLNVLRLYHCVPTTEIIKTTIKAIHTIGFIKHLPFLTQCLYCTITFFIFHQHFTFLGDIHKLKCFFSFFLDKADSFRYIFTIISYYFYDKE